MIKAFYGDPHFGHRNIIRHAGRPFRDLDHMHAELVKRYNANVGRYDTVIWTGDAFFGPVEGAREILASMNGAKVLVMGNHDGSKARAARCGFDFVVDEMEMHIGGRHCIVSHYPYAGSRRSDGTIDKRDLDKRPKRVKGRALIHGHTHERSRGDRNAVHVGVDAWAYYPAMLADVANVMGEGCDEV